MLYINEARGRGIDMTKAKKIERLKGFIDKLNNGERVQNRDIKKQLSNEQYQQMFDAWEEQKYLREEIKSKPEEVIGYEAKLKKALFAYNKADCIRNDSARAKRLFGQADRLFEELLEYLQEIIAADAELQIWFDRDTNWTKDGDIALSPIAVPRVVTSKSLDKMGRGLVGAIVTKQQVKVDAIKRAINELENDADSNEQQSALKAKLATLIKKSSY